MAQELLATFEEELGGVTLVPNAEGGVFEVRSGAKRSSRGRMPGDSPRSPNSSGLCAIELRPAATSDTWIVSSLDGRPVRDPVHLPSQLDVQRGDATRVVVERSTTTPFQTLNYSG